MAGEVSQSHAKSTGIVSIFILIFAAVNLITGFVFVSYGAKDATGIWIGLLLGVGGILGVIVWVKKSKTVEKIVGVAVFAYLIIGIIEYYCVLTVQMVFFMVICIIDIITCIVQAALAAIAFLIWQILKAIIETKCKIVGNHCDCGDEKVPMELQDCTWINAIEAIFLVILIVNGLATIFVFAGSIIGCMATCCASSPPPAQQGGVVIIQQPVAGYPPPAGATAPPPPGYGMEMAQKS